MNKFLNKPIIISILLFLFSLLLLEFFPSFINMSLPFQSIIISFFLGLVISLFQEKLKIIWDKTNKIKIAVYYSLTYIILFIPISTFLSYIGVKHPIVPFITALIFSGLYLAYGFFMYLGLLLGDKFKLKNKII